MISSLFAPQTKEIRGYYIAWYNLSLLGAITFQCSSNVLISDCTTNEVFGTNNELNWLVNGFSSSTRMVPRLRLGTISRVTMKQFTNLHVYNENPNYTLYCDFIHNKYVVIYDHYFAINLELVKIIDFRVIK